MGINRQILSLLFILFSFSGIAQQEFFNTADLFFKKYVHEGRINYSLIKTNSSDLAKMVQLTADFPLSDEIGNTNKAYYINAYNIIVIRQIIDNYPVKSPQDIPGFFDTNPYNIAGTQRTLNQIENEVLRLVYKDPRIHFVLVCGGLGCPPIPNFAYTPKRLETQLENQTKRALNNPDFIRVNDKQLGLSEIFKWYADDFSDSSSDLISYINTYRDQPVPENAEVYYYPYDWAINDYKVGELHSSSKTDIPEEVATIYTYTPSSLLKKGQIESQLFNNVYTQTAYRDGNRDKVELNTRDTYYSGLVYALYGVSNKARVNVGFHLTIKSVFSDTAKGSPFKVFGFQNTDHSRTAISSVGPKIKFQPFKKLSHFSVQSAFWIPVGHDMESIEDDSSYPWLDYQMYTWWNQFFYDYSPSANWQIFTEADLLFRFQSEKSNTPTHLDVPVSIFVSWFPARNVSLYAQAQYSPRFQLKKTVSDAGDGQPEFVTDPFSLISDYAHTGLGAKYQLTRNLNLELSSTYFFTSKNGGAGFTYNLGFRIIL